MAEPALHVETRALVAVQAAASQVPAVRASQS
ncbi:hypothetical protein BJY16_007361 [Actinoplanes octamycinicus]|uniref:Uncharacterized protein n=1 Tax=Actinoplanes octamycinicus TaxID=135948 RepID=A0A7W7H5B0_9ACTN|nr:hypothetical protein [Actinoplanes octamycinicus]